MPPAIVGSTKAPMRDARLLQQPKPATGRHSTRNCRDMHMSAGRAVSPTQDGHPCQPPPIFCGGRRRADAARTHPALRSSNSWRGTGRCIRPCQCFKLHTETHPAQQRQTARRVIRSMAQARARARLARASRARRQAPARRPCAAKGRRAGGRARARGARGCTYIARRAARGLVSVVGRWAVLRGAGIVLWRPRHAGARGAVRGSTRGA